ncbi:MAG: hypothetical protein H0X17_02670 [Deltaproteobacteria bacterium]|nr:hypothetical protein [Deltaproteobacteria bacterium]
MITRQADFELARIHDKIEHKVLVDGRTDLEELFGRLLDAIVPGAPIKPRTLDLIGHSTAGKSLLQVGDWVIDRTSATVTAFFRELADQDVLGRLGIHAVRLLGCQTADTTAGRDTITALANILGVEVFGTTELLYSAHYDAGGFRDECSHVLICASDLRQPPETRGLATARSPYPRTLDIDALPAAALRGPIVEWPRRIASFEAGRELLGLIRRTEGAHMPGLLATPSCEIVMPAAHPGAYHRMQVLLAGDFVRVYPDGDDQPGVLYPVDDARALVRLADALPLASL